MRILCLSDQVVPLIYSPRVSVLYSQVDLVVSCGDLPYHYLDYVVCHINKPLFYVEGNHVRLQENGKYIPSSRFHGGMDMHAKVHNHSGLLLAGIAGSLRYSGGEYQYTQAQMWLYAFRLVPRLLLNRLLYGRYLDVFITHSPPAGIHDQPDLPHRGIASFLWIDKVFNPRLHLHGHIHTYRPDTISETIVDRTRVINIFPYREVVLKS